MHEGIHSEPQEPTPRFIKDLAPAKLGEVRVDTEGNKWVLVPMYHTKGEEPPAGARPEDWWSAHLEQVSDDAIARARDVASGTLRNLEDLPADVAYRWVPLH